MLNTAFYKFTLMLNTSQSKGNFILPNSARDIIEAKDRFNTRFSGSRHILILRLTSNTVDLLLRLDNHESEKNVTLRTLYTFVNTLKNDFNWKSHFKKESARLFTAPVIKQLDTAECEKLVREMGNEQNDYFDTISAKSLFLDVDTGKEDISSEYYDAENSRLPYEVGTTRSLADAVDKISTLTGFAQFKEEVSKIIKYCNYIKAIRKPAESVHTAILPCHYIFKGDNGVNMLEPAKLLTEVLFHLNAINSRKFVRLDISGAGNSYSGINLEEYMDEADTGVVYIEKLFECNEDVDTNKVLAKLTEKMQQLRGKTLFILAFCSSEESLQYTRVLDYLKERINYRKVTFEIYSDENIIEIARHAAGQNRCDLNAEAFEQIVAGIRFLSRSPQFDAEYTINRYIEKAILDKGFEQLSIPSDNELPFSLTKSDFLFTDEDKTSENKPLTELEKMVGLQEVKNRVHQIIDNVTVRMRKKELGLISNPVCLHMAFTGNPGTGKTTVARLLGQIFKELGFLSTGNFVEVTRDSLVGQYIGQTTPKVRKAVKDAKGGILFIDEAYNLYQPYENDFGYEAVAELVKCMEDYKDDLVVIFAGYPKEMEQMIRMNPGLRDRIAFKIEFPDYQKDNLFEIFKMMLAAGGYKIEAPALDEACRLVETLYLNKDKNFGNARVIRKLYERAEMAQNTRICLEKKFDVDKIAVLVKEDLLKLYEDSEIAKLLKPGQGGASIGFRV